MLKDIKSVYLMLEDTQICYVNFEDSVFALLAKELLPVPLRKSSDKMSNDIKTIINCIYEFKSWLSSRVISMSLGNYKQLSAYFNIAQSSSVDYKAKVALNCRAISLEDAYWLKFENEDICWADVNPNTKRFKNIVTVALDKTVPSITGDINHPDISMTGTFPKTWLRDGGTLKLLKAGKTDDSINVVVEAAASDFYRVVYSGTLDAVTYDLAVINANTRDILCTICSSYYKDGFSVVKAQDLIEYMGLSKYMQWLHVNPIILRSIANMVVMDYITADTDRHTDNYGFYMDNKNGSITHCIPFYDFNYAFIADLLGTNYPEVMCQTFNDGRNMREVVTEFAKYSDVTLHNRLLCNFFLNNRVVESKVLERIRFIEELSGRNLIVDRDLTECSLLRLEMLKHAAKLNVSFEELCMQVYREMPESMKTHIGVTCDAMCYWSTYKKLHRTNF